MKITIFGCTLAISRGIRQRYVPVEQNNDGRHNVPPTIIEEPYAQIQAGRSRDGLYHLKIFPPSLKGLVGAVRYLISV